MRNRSTLIALAVSGLFCGCTTVKAPDDYRSLFNGIDLTMWEGDPAIWSVKNGAITGATTAEDPLKNNTFLVWKGGDVDDFELRLKYKIVNGNSGVQYRSKVIDPKKFIVGGYQADFEAGKAYSGILYEERGRGILAERGQKVTINPDGSKTAEKFADSNAIQVNIREEDWNDYVVIARGNHLIHKINGIKTVEVIDNQADKAAKSGVLALQAHAGPPMVVQFKDIRIKQLAGEKLDAAKPRVAVPRGDSTTGAADPQTVVGGATSVEWIKLIDGFKAELIYAVPKEQQGSWVNLCVEKDDRLIASDQAGKLYRITPPGLSGRAWTWLPWRKGKRSEVKVEPIDVEIGEAHGLLYAFDSLYVVVNGDVNQGSGLYRVRDTDGDDRYDSVELLRKLEGKGEHGPHAVVLSPDKKSLYIVAGNFTKVPNPETSRVPTNWDEDQLLPRMPDGGGHDPHIMAPGGWTAKTDPDGKTWELVATGFRNHFDAAFNEAGDLFTFDSDMEWDIGAPWYRPTRVCQVVSGAEFGWRNGSGKWPVYYPDSLPPVLDIGPGSPTGVVFGYEADFPKAYRNALFICDWSFGKMYAVHLDPEGASYRAEAEQFLAASPLPLTDVVVNPKDGAMYLTVGGRGVQSALYRVTYGSGKVDRKVAKFSRQDKKLRDLRLKLEQFHGKQDAKAVDTAWPYLGHEDRFVRFAARIAVEHQPVEQWQSRAVEERYPQASLTALLALARQGDKAACGQLLESLGRFDYPSLSQQHRLEALRVLGLTMIRMGRPDDATIARIVERLDPHYPAASVDENYELSRLMAYFEAPTAVEKTMALLAEAPTQEEQIHYAMVLRNVKTGWTPRLREAYFGWFGGARHFRGGHSLARFLVNMRNEAVAGLIEAEKLALADVLRNSDPAAAVPPPPQQDRPFVKEWTVDEVAKLARGNLKGRNYENGRKMFAAAQCYNCHRFNGEGGSVGPDLSAVAGRFTVRDLAESIVEPSKVVSDQYRNTIFNLDTGQQVIGRVANLNGDKLMVVTNQLAPGDFTDVDRNHLVAAIESPVSPMMPGLLNTLSEQEVLDLMAYLLSGGDRGHVAFR